MNILYKPNPLIEGILETDKKIDIEMFNLILCNLQKQKKSTVYHISIVNLEDFKRIVKDNTLNRPKNLFYYLTNTFQKKVIRWKEETFWNSVTLINKVSYDETNQEFIFFLDEDLMKIVLYYKDINELRNETHEKKIGITPLNLELMNKGKTFNSQRLYEILRQWSGIGKKSFTVLELKERLFIKDNYKDYYDFKKYVLKPALEKINKDFNMKVEFEEKKKGRKIHEIIFYIKDFEPRYYNLKENIVDINEEDIVDVSMNTNNKKSILAESTINKLIKEYSEEIVSEGLKIMEENSKKQKISAPKKYLIGILDNLKETSIRQDAISSVNTNKTKVKVSNFANFTQRKYDHDKLEKQLLGWDDEDDYEDESNKEKSKEQIAIEEKLKELGSKHN